jgi:hypothetical protein
MPTCIRCATEFPKRQGKNVYCETCRPIVIIETGRLRYLQETGQRTLATTIRCGDCSMEVPRLGHRHRYCAACKKIRDKERDKRYAVRHPEKLKATQAAHNARRLHDPIRRAKMREYAKKHEQKQADNPKYKLIYKMRSQIYQALKTGKQGKLWTRRLDYSLSDLQHHLEQQFTDGMTWGNMGKWHLDHIVPVSRFNFNSIQDEDFKACWALLNLRPLWASENVKKHNL